MSTATLPPPAATPPVSLPPLPETLGPAHNGLKMSGDEWDAHSDWAEGYTYELIDGVLVVCPAPGPGERKPNSKIGQLILNFIDANPSGPVKETLDEQYVRVAPNRRRRCDRAIWLGELPEDPDETVPDIVIEIVSSSSRDRRRDYIVKRAEYAAAGVREYWVLDRYDRIARLFAADGTERTIPQDGVIATTLMPGFELPMSVFLEAADRYA